MVLKEQYEGDFKESAAGGVGLSLIPNKLEDMTASYIRQVKEIIGQSSIHNTQFMYDQLLEQLSNGLTVEGEETQSNREMPGFEGTMDSLNNLSIRESAKKIKSEFQRYL